MHGFAGRTGFASLRDTETRVCGVEQHLGISERDSVAHVDVVSISAVLKHLRAVNCAVNSVETHHFLQIDELKGTKATEKIDLSRKGLGVASAIIIASCIKENGMLKGQGAQVRRPPPRAFAFVSAPAEHSRPWMPSRPQAQLAVQLQSQRRC